MVKFNFPIGNNWERLGIKSIGNGPKFPIGIHDNPPPPASCIGIKPKRYKELQSKSDPWSCNKCRLASIANKPDEEVEAIVDDKIYWGDMLGVENMSREVSKIYSKVAGWIPNLFLLPSGKEGKDFIDELQITLRHFTDETPCERLSITAFLTMIPLILQKPSKS